MTADLTLNLDQLTWVTNVHASASEEADACDMANGRNSCARAHTHTHTHTHTQLTPRAKRRARARAPECELCVRSWCDGM